MVRTLGRVSRLRQADSARLAASSAGAPGLPRRDGDPTTCTRTVEREIDREQGQAHLPAQQPPPCQDPWVPAADAHPRGASDHFGAPAQGSYRAVGLITGRHSAAVLPAAARLTSSQEFGTVVRRGHRAGRPRLVVHALIESNVASSPIRVGKSTARVGFVVSKAVGNSVVRHRVTRQLRHLVRDRLGTLPAGCTLVIRALPAAAGSASAELAADLDGALRRLRLSGDAA